MIRISGCAVGWAESDYWAQRAWVTPFPGELAAPAPQWGPPPSLGFLGRPEVLALEAVKEFERLRLTVLQAAVRLEMARYRVTDGALMSAEVRGADGLTYFYAPDETRPDGRPSAIEFRLPERDRGQ